MASRSMLNDAASVLGLDINLLSAADRIALYQAYATNQLALAVDRAAANLGALSGTADHALSIRVHGGLR